jgi:hypothetical protein
MKGNTLRIAKPSSKPGSQDRIIKELLMTCSDIIRALSLQIFEFDDERLLSFAGDLAEGNLI